MNVAYRLKTVLTINLIILANIVLGQTQVVKGTLVDVQSEAPLIGASVILIGSDPIIGAVTDIDGQFRIEGVPYGRQTFAASFVGYKNLQLPNVLVTAGKEVVLNVKLEESVESLEEVVVTAGADKDRPINEMAKVSARTFSLEETMRFSGGRNDVARLATSFAGVSAPNDSRNDIVVRGNAPTGLLWRVEGLPVATTNHFSTLGVTGGPVNALNTNLLRTSDFLTGAFPAEYGNANAAVFDVNFRNGNTDKFEFTGQLSAYSGMEFMAEGPINRAKESSFVASYRYGIASLAATGTSAIPYYQDFSFKVNLGKSKIGRFEIFGLGGLSSIDFYGDEIDENDLFANPDQDAFVSNILAVTGINHLARIDNNTYVKTTLGVATTLSFYDQDNLMKDGSGNTIGKYRATEVANKEYRYTLSSVLNKKFNARLNLRTGFIHEMYDPSFLTRDRDNRIDIPDTDNNLIPDYFLTVIDVKESYHLTQLFGQAEYKFSDELSTTFGVHSQLLTLNNTYSVEPRAAISYQLNPVQRVSFAYGLHAQAIPAPIMFYEEEVAPGTYERTNADLGFSKSHHFIAAYDRNFGSNWRLKSEIYYQHLFDIPVESNSSSYSIINEGADFVFDQRGSLINEGTGTNYGLELTLEKFFSNNYYMLMTTSLYESKYKGSDGIERNTAFNNNLVYNLLAGKEWKFGAGQRNAFTLDTKLTASGGKPYTPVDLEATRMNAGREVKMENVAYSEKYGDYFRWDVKFGVRMNSRNKNLSHQFFVDLQNVTDRENEFVYRYNEVTDDINLVSQIGFFPDVMYRIQF
ncbi:MAG: carboxypeptidase-like regulatory domain-containing protein [Bacteroidota bacterium]